MLSRIANFTSKEILISAPAPLRSGQLSLDEGEYFQAQPRGQRRYSPMMFGIVPRMLFGFHPGKRSASPESQIVRES
jgi:hypothetical protein